MVAHTLLALYKQRATGELVVTSPSTTSPPWRLYFYAGCLVYATGGNHPVRRWYRALRQHCYQFHEGDRLLEISTDKIGWELDLLNQALNTSNQSSDRNQINASQAKLVLQSIVQEILFAIVQQSKVTSEWHPDHLIDRRLAFLSVEQLLETATQFQADWQTAQLDRIAHSVHPYFLPDLTPTLQKTRQLEESISPILYRNLIRFLQGTHTLWDIAVAMQRPLPAILHALMPWIQSNVIDLQKISDILLPGSSPEAITLPRLSNPKAIIACIDDSPTIGRTLSHMLNPLGYEILPILNPLQGITTLLDRKPDLIFLDLIMPNTNGYELCTFLRKTSVFQNTPIIILTDNDGFVDRVRAKFVGSSEFLSKPIDQERTIKVVQKYLNSEQKTALLPATQMAIA